MIKSTNIIDSSVLEIQDIITKVSNINILKGKTVVIADRHSELFEALFTSEFRKSSLIAQCHSDPGGIDKIQLEKPSTLGTVVWVKTGVTPYFHENLNEIFRRLITGGKLLIIGIVTVDAAAGASAASFPDNDIFSVNADKVMGFQELVLNIHEAGFGDIEILKRKDFIIENDIKPLTTYSIAVASAVKQCIGQVFEGCPAGCNKCE